MQEQQARQDLQARQEEAERAATMRLYNRRVGEAAALAAMRAELRDNRPALFMHTVNSSETQQQRQDQQENRAARGRQAAVLRARQGRAEEGFIGDIFDEEDL